MRFAFDLLEKGVLPDLLIRSGIRMLLARKLAEESRGGPEGQSRRFAAVLEQLRRSPISMHADLANRQHYEVPAAFFEQVLGRRLKYSSGYWPQGVRDLDEAEEAMLRLTAERARLQDGQRVLELGCGWGSLCLYLAERFPSSRITAVSNSRSQKEFIDGRARAAGLRNLTVVTGEMGSLEVRGRFDRVVSVEMFEHMRNYERLFEKVAGFLERDGELFVHVFTHRQFAYLYQETDSNDWIAQYFFTGGTMPSDSLFLYFQDHMRLAEHWQVSGTHYQKTCRAWLERMDRRRAVIEPVFRQVYGEQARRWWVYWRVFFMACEELFGFRGGREWGVSHYRFDKR